ncbi:hypothetical protein A8M77_34150 [Variovorax sp. JS1663]|nr:hypothetical protein A8M77_34150 [Variovorax sp. JS1663]
MSDFVYDPASIDISAVLNLDGRTTFLATPAGGSTVSCTPNNSGQWDVTGPLATVDSGLPVTNFFNSATTTALASAGQPLADATSAGPSALNNTLFSAPTYSIAAISTWLGDVNLAQGNQALANYFLTDGLRPGNSNLGTSIDQSTGIGLNFPAGTNPYGYSLFGSSLNNYAAANDRLFPADPLVLDLDGDGVKLTSYGSAPVLFDADNDGGSLEQTGWVSAQDGIVVHDLNNDGKINSQALGRSAAHLISKNQLLANDRDWDSVLIRLDEDAIEQADWVSAYDSIVLHDLSYRSRFIRITEMLSGGGA